MSVVTRTGLRRNFECKTEAAIDRPRRGVEISGRVDQQLQDIQVHTRKVNELVAEVAAASREQSQGISRLLLRRLPATRGKCPCRCPPRLTEPQRGIALKRTELPMEDDFKDF